MYDQPNGSVEKTNTFAAKWAACYVAMGHGSRWNLWVTSIVTGHGVTSRGSLLTIMHHWNAASVIVTTLAKIVTTGSQNHKSITRFAESGPIRSRQRALRRPDYQSWKIIQ